MERLYTDLVEPMKHQSLGKSQYFITFLDEYSGYAMVRLIKCGAAGSVSQMIIYLEKIFNDKLLNLNLINRKSVKWIRSDEGGKCVGHHLHKWLLQRGIIWEVKTAYSPESNGNAKRLNRTLMAVANNVRINEWHKWPAMVGSNQRVFFHQAQAVY